MRHQSIDKLRALRLAGMARALEEQMAQADIGRLSFDERLAMLIDREEVDRHNAALAQRLRLAHLRQAVCLEDIDFSTPRGLTMRQRQSSTEEKSRSNSNISNNIPDTHTIHSRAATKTKKDQETQ